jgi:hypothetical protein
MTASAPVTGPAPRTAGNPFGLVAFLLAAALLLLGIVTRILSYALPQIVRDSGASVSTFTLVFAVTGVIGLLIGIAAAILGIVGVTRPGRAHALAGAGLAIGIFQVGAWIVSVVGNPIVGALVTHR